MGDTLYSGRAGHPGPREGTVLRIVFAGTPEPAVPSLTALLHSAHEVVAVITRPDARRGRGRALHPSPVAVAAQAAGVEVLRPASARDPELLARLTELAPDAAAVVAYGNLIPAVLLDLPRHGWVNLHFSLLPAWRGAAPVQAAVRAGDDVTGATTFRLERGLDTGPVFGVLTERIDPRDTAGALLDRLAVSGADLLVATMDGLADGSLHARPQPADGVSLAPKITPDDARVVWTHPAAAVDRHIRAVTPDPGAWTDSPWGRLILGPVELAPARADGTASPAPGELVAGKREVLVGTGAGAVRLGTVTPPGRKAMNAADWARGVRPDPGARLGSPDPATDDSTTDGSTTYDSTTNDSEERP